LIRDVPVIDLQTALAEAEDDLVDEHRTGIDDEADAAGFLTMARRLPGLVAQGLRLSWQTSRWETAAVIVLNLLTAALTSFGLLATAGALQELLAAGPTASAPRSPHSSWSAA
jgi:hypothetical protein